MSLSTDISGTLYLAYLREDTKLLGDTSNITIFNTAWDGDRGPFIEVAYLYEH